MTQPAPGRTTATPPGVAPRDVVRYALGSVGTGGFGTLPGLVLAYYLTDSLAVPAALAGAVIAVSKVWDVVVDPFIGWASDRDLARRGSRRRLMTLGALSIPVFFTLTFAAPAGAGPTAAALWVLVAFLLAATAFSLFQVPYIALPAELARTYDERTRLLGWRVAALAVAILLFGAGGPALRGDGSPAGYLVLGAVAGVVIGAGMLVASRAAPRLPAGERPAPPAAGGPLAVARAALGQAASVLGTSRSFRALLATFFLQALATGLMLAAASYVATYVLESEAAVSLLFAALIAPALLVMPLWTRLAARAGKERALVLATVLFAVATLAMTPLLWAPGAWVYLPTALAGVAYAGMQALPLAMLPDVIDVDARRAGATAAGPSDADRGGAFSGVWTAGETTGMGLGAVLLTVVLALSAFRSSTAAETVVQPASAVDGIALAFSVVPAALVALSLVPLSRYALRRSDVEAGARPDDTADVVHPAAPSSSPTRPAGPADPATTPEDTP